MDHGTGEELQWAWPTVQSSPHHFPLPRRGAPGQVARTQPSAEGTKPPSTSQPHCEPAPCALARPYTSASSPTGPQSPCLGPPGFSAQPALPRAPCTPVLGSPCPPGDHRPADPGQPTLEPTGPASLGNSPPSPGLPKVPTPLTPAHRGPPALLIPVPRFPLPAAPSLPNRSPRLGLPPPALPGYRRLPHLPVPAPPTHALPPPLLPGPTHGTPNERLPPAAADKAVGRRAAAARRTKGPGAAPPRARPPVLTDRPAPSGCRRAWSGAAVPLRPGRVTQPPGGSLPPRSRPGRPRRAAGRGRPRLKLARASCLSATSAAAVPAFQAAAETHSFPGGCSQSLQPLGAGSPLLPPASALAPGAAHPPRGAKLKVRAGRRETLGVQQQPRGPWLSPRCGQGWATPSKRVPVSLATAGEEGASTPAMRLTCTITSCPPHHQILPLSVKRERMEERLNLIAPEKSWLYTQWECVAKCGCVMGMCRSLQQGQG